MSMTMDEILLMGDVIDSATKELMRQATEIARMRAEIADLKESVIAFCGPWAGVYARDAGLPDGHLYPTHYDILERCGARMVAFTRAVLKPQA